MSLASARQELEDEWEVAQEVVEEIATSAAEDVLLADDRC